MSRSRLDIRSRATSLAGLSRAVADAGGRPVAIAFLNEALRHLTADDVDAHSAIAAAARMVGETEVVAIIEARALVLKGYAVWPAGGARELLRDQADLWESGPSAAFITIYLFGTPNDGEGALRDALDRLPVPVRVERARFG